MRTLTIAVMVSLIGGTAKADVNLVDMVNRGGLVSAASRSDLSARDISGLRLLAQFGLPGSDYVTATFADNAKASKYRSGPSKMMKATPVCSIRSGLTMSQCADKVQQTEQVARYFVAFRNHTSDTVTEIKVFYRTRDGLLSSTVFRNLVPQQIAILDLGVCDQMVDYVLGVYMGTEEIFHIPQTGTMTPASAARFNSTDTDPCEDSWGLYEN